MHGLEQDETSTSTACNCPEVGSLTSTSKRHLSISTSCRSSEPWHCHVLAEQFCIIFASFLHHFRIILPILEIYCQIVLASASIHRAAAKDWTWDNCSKICRTGGSRITMTWHQMTMLWNTPGVVLHTVLTTSSTSSPSNSQANLAILPMCKDTFLWTSFQQSSNISNISIGFY